MTSSTKFYVTDSNSIVDMFVWPNFGNCTISMAKVITSIFKDLTRKNDFFVELSGLKFNNLGLALGMLFRFYNIVTKGLKLKVRKF